MINRKLARYKNLSEHGTSVTPAGTETADVSIPETTTEHNSATQDTQTKPTHKRALNDVVEALGYLLVVALAAYSINTLKTRKKAAEEARIKAEREMMSSILRPGVSTEAVMKLFQQAAEAGDANAQYYLGECYEKGIDVKKNRQKAKEWYRKAAAQGIKEAAKGMGKN